MQVVVFEKFVSAYLNHIALEIMLSLVNNLHVKHHRKSIRMKFCQSTFCNLQLCFNFALVTRKMHLFSANQMCNFFMYIIIGIIWYNFTKISAQVLFQGNDLNHIDKFPWWFFEVEEGHWNSVAKQASSLILYSFPEEYMVLQQN